MMFCGNCGAQLSEGQAQCPCCGTDVTNYFFASDFSVNQENNSSAMDISQSSSHCENFDDELLMSASVVMSSEEQRKGRSQGNGLSSSPDDTEKAAKKKKRGVLGATAAIAVLVVLAIVLIANGVFKTNGGEPAHVQGLKIDEVGYTITNDGRVDFAVIVSNGNTNWLAKDIEVIATALDDEGDIVDTTNVYSASLHANGKTALCGSIYEASRTEKMRFKVNAASIDWVKQDMQQTEFDKLVYAREVNEIKNKREGREETLVTGEIVNKTPDMLSGLSVNIVYRNMNGAIVGGTSAHPSIIGSNSTMPFSTKDYNSPKHSKIDIYVDGGYASS